MSTGSSGSALDGMAHEPASGLAEHDLPRQRRLLEPLGDADGCSGGEGLAGAGIGDEHLAGVQPDPDLQRDAVGLGEIRVQLAERIPQLGCGANGTERVVLVRGRNAERRHRRVADELLDDPAVALDDRPNHVEVAGEDAAHDLGVELRAELGGVDQVCEQDRDRLAAVGLGQRDALAWWRLEVEVGILAQDRLLEALELGRGIDAELVDERLAGPAVGVERIRLPAAPVEREHQQADGPLPQRMLGDERLELADHLGRAAEL